MRNLLIAKVCGADSDLIAATPDQRPGLAKAAALFSEEDLTRFFQILLQTDDDLRRKPDPRVHLEMGLLRLVNAARLAPLEELLAETRGGSKAGFGWWTSGRGMPEVAGPAASLLSRTASARRVGFSGAEGPAFFMRRGRQRGGRIIRSVRINRKPGAYMEPAAAAIAVCDSGRNVFISAGETRLASARLAAC